ncbi:hypothetical protein [Sinomonas sp. ASV322]|uniref:hypothetical protein n=1 Tax=Sinomonas sp. ASV322 TaxID=3041920 RepID=UPI0027DB83EA|nr:hypothetical protein [Sinomonas sp. ASV322]MDQ4501259.1 hypothetical protein [Sinomonas sp. ASV322]
MARHAAPWAERLNATARACRGPIHAIAPVVAAALLLMAPATAQASFAAAGAAALTASTYSIPAPASVNASYVCASNGKLATVTVLSYSTVPRATAYTFTLTAPDGTSSSTTTTLTTVVLAQSSASAGNRIYTLTVQARVGSWIGAALTQTHGC